MNREYQNLCPDVNRETLRKDLNDLINKKAIIRKGEKKEYTTNLYNMPTLCHLYLLWQGIFRRFGFK